MGGLCGGLTVYAGIVSLDHARVSRRLRPSARLRALLVFSVLIGLLSMHGLTTAGAAPHAHADARPCHHAQLVLSPPHACESHQGTSGHHDRVSHADQMCVSSSVPGSTAFQGLAPSPFGCEPDAGLLLLGTGVHEAGEERAPPSLAKLQLLRM
ncbi:DUF6153 family protein [Streptomyces pristinaespiralis]|uniref:DUF6153 family protein n=1 Tax=Streptomyces pristinaespiralis TaxID=38300 RepID=UPI0033E709F6